MKPAAAPKRETIVRPYDPSKVAWQWGYDAAADGYPDTCCPWSEGQPSHTQWHAGYAAALKGD